MAAMEAGLGNRKNGGYTGQKKMTLTAQAEVKNFSDTGSWGTSCLPPPFRPWIISIRLTTQRRGYDESEHLELEPAKTK